MASLIDTPENSAKIKRIGELFARMAKRDEVGDYAVEWSVHQGCITDFASSVEQNTHGIVAVNVERNGEFAPTTLNDVHLETLDSTWHGVVGVAWSIGRDGSVAGPKKTVKQKFR